MANGALREGVLARRLSGLRAHQVSCLTGATLILVCAYALSRLRPLASPSEALAVGLAWLLLTTAFEFFMGRVLLRKPLAECLADYRLDRGRLWVLVLAAVTAAPLLCRLV